MPKKSIVKNSSLGRSRKILYVILHGLICLVDIGEDGFIGYVLEMGDAHKYLYGDWLDEDDIPTRKDGEDPVHARLLGVKEDGDDDLDDQLNAVFNLTNIPSSTHPFVRAIIHLPRPTQIYQRLQGSIDDDALSGSLGDLANTPTHISGIRIFEYDIEDEDEVSLVFDEGSVWRCPTPLANLKHLHLKVGVLHIYNEPHEILCSETSHNRGEFNSSSKFLGSDVLFGKETLFLVKNDAIPGILPGEMEFLSLRGNQVLRMVYKERGAPKGPKDKGSGPGQVCGGLNAVLIPTAG